MHCGLLDLQSSLCWRLSPTSWFVRSGCGQVDGGKDLTGARGVWRPSWDRAARRREEVCVEGHVHSFSTFPEAPVEASSGTQAEALGIKGFKNIFPIPHPSVWCLGRYTRHPHAVPGPTSPPFSHTLPSLKGMVTLGSGTRHPGGPCCTSSTMPSAATCTHRPYHPAMGGTVGSSGPFLTAGGSRGGSPGREPWVQA